MGGVSCLGVLLVGNGRSQERRMLRCEFCGRSPAKEMSFTAHQGFLIFERQIQVAGAFCRDCALEAYAQSQGHTLMGMWFSPGSLVRGTLQTLWDSAKLLDLPEEVKDGPLVPHKVGCPHCRHSHFVPAGANQCESCKEHFLVLSCASCDTVHVSGSSEGMDAVDLTCRSCSKVTKRPRPCRNSPTFLLIRALAEIADITEVSKTEFATWCEQLAVESPLQASSWKWARSYFRKCNEAPIVGSWEVLTSALQTGQTRFLAYALTVARGLISDERVPALEAYMAAVGYDPNIFNESDDPGEVPAEEEVNWRLILGLGNDAGLEEAQKAFKKLAVKYHPDFWHDAASQDKQTAERRMKEITVAYAAAKIALGGAAAVQFEYKATKEENRAKEPKPSQKKEAEPAAKAPKPTPETKRQETKVPEPASTPPKEPSPAAPESTASTSTAPVSADPASDQPKVEKPDVAKEPPDKVKSTRNSKDSTAANAEVQLKSGQEKKTRFGDGFVLGAGFITLVALIGLIAWGAWLEVNGYSIVRVDRQQSASGAEGSTSNTAQQDFSPAALLGIWTAKGVEYDFGSDGQLTCSKTASGETVSLRSEWKLESGKLSAWRDGKCVWSCSIKKLADAELVLENGDGRTLELRRDSSP
jgi:hypothetical protein